MDAKPVMQSQDPILTNLWRLRRSRSSSSYCVVRHKRPTLSLAMLALFLCACSSGQASTTELGPGQRPGSTGEPPEQQVKSGELVKVDAIQINILESAPVQVNVTLQGHLTNGCTQVTNISPLRKDTTFTITFYSQPIEGVDCNSSTGVPFQETVPLDMEGLPAGTYTVEAYGISETFTLSQENIQSGESACPAPGMSTQQFSNNDPTTGIGYCFLFPANFTAVPPSTPGVTILVGPSYGEGPEPVQATLTITTFDLAGKSLQEYVSGQIASAAPGLEINQSEVDLGNSIQAIQVEGLPGRTGTRVLFAEANNLVFKLTFAPTEDDHPQVKSDLESLFNTVIASWVFQP